MSYSNDLRVLFTESRKGANEDSLTVFPPSRNILKMYKKRKPGFFASCETVGEFASSVVAPVFDPLVFGFLTSSYLVLSTAAAIMSPVLALVACGAGLFGFSKFSGETFKEAGVSLKLTAYSLGMAALSLAVAILSIPYNLLSLLTSTAATVVKPIVDYCAPADDEVPPIATPS